MLQTVIAVGSCSQQLPCNNTMTGISYQQQAAIVTHAQHV
jgi:hypothetical protein